MNFRTNYRISSALAILASVLGFSTTAMSRSEDTASMAYVTGAISVVLLLVSIVLGVITSRLQKTAGNTELAASDSIKDNK